MSIIVITPTRGRPAKAADCYEHFLQTKTLETTKMAFVVDSDDDTFNEYIEASLPVVTYEHEGGGMGPPMNVAALDHAEVYDHIGFIGDDHRFRTKGWDEVFEAVLSAHGMVFANDLTRHDIPTQVFMRSTLVKALGWFCLPGAKHLYLDNTWALLGQQLKTMVFAKEVVIEHVHPFFRKDVAMDEGYARVNQQSMYDHDRVVFEEWIKSGRAAEDISRAREALRETAD